MVDLEDQVARWMFSAREGSYRQFDQLSSEMRRAYRAKAEAFRQFKDEKEEDVMGETDE